MRDDMLETPMTTKKEGVYMEYQPLGSNQQWGAGFMFGPRPTYKKVRESIKVLHDDKVTASDELNADNSTLEIQRRLTNAQEIKVTVGTAKEGGTKVEVEGKQPETPAFQFPAGVIAGTITQGAIENTSAEMLAAKVEEDELSNDLDINENAVLETYWDEKIENDPVKKAIFANNGMSSYLEMLDIFNAQVKQGMYPTTLFDTAEEQFKEFNKCLK